MGRCDITILDQDGIYRVGGLGLLVAPPASAATGRLPLAKMSVNPRDDPAHLRGDGSAHTGLQPRKWQITATRAILGACQIPPFVEIEEGDHDAPGEEPSFPKSD